MPAGETIFDLVRHAHAYWVPDELRPLSRAGQRAAHRVAQLLVAPSPPVPTISTIVSSPSLRARQTVVPLADRLGLPIEINADLRERDLGHEPIDAAAFQTVVRITWDDPDYRRPGAESNREAQNRGLIALWRLLRDHPGEHLVLATHGNLLALVLQHYDPSVGFEFWSALAMPDVYRLRLLEAHRGHIEHLIMPEQYSISAHPRAVQESRGGETERSGP